MKTHKPWKKLPKQVEACSLMNKHRETMLLGGSRSTKTSIIVRQIAVRAMKRPSTHLMVRLRFNHAYISLYTQTWVKIMEGFFPGYVYSMNKNYYNIEVPCVGEYAGETSTIWIGGIDSGDRMEKILGNEYSTIFVNECSQIDYEAIEILRTRLAENSGLDQRFYMDMNPPGKRHWSHKLFIEKLNPVDKTPTDIDVGCLLMNPKDNPLLSEDYIRSLKNLSKRQQDRFLEGKFTNDVEGALWDSAMIIQANAREHGEIQRAVIGVDPSTTANPGSDECGIVAAGRDEEGTPVILGDYSDKLSPSKWAKEAVKAYHRHGAYCIVAESNQGGEMIRDQIHSVDPNVKVELIHATTGKFSRAEPVAALYERGEVGHDPVYGDLSQLEEEMETWVPDETTYSPNRLDAMVYSVSKLKGFSMKRSAGLYNFGKTS